VKRYKVIQWGLGYIGAPAVKYILQNDHLDLVGMKCFTPGKVGLTAGEIAGLEPGGVKATDSAEDLIAMDADCVIYMPRDPHTDPSIPGSPSSVWVPEVVALLESGKNVISSIGSCTHWRQLANGEQLRDRFNAACAKGGTTLYFTGMDPGFNTDALVFMLSSAVGAIRGIRTYEIIDYGAYTVESVLRQLGFGGPRSQLAHAHPTFHAVWGGAIHLLADALGIAIDRIEVESEGAEAPEGFVAEGGMEIPKGTIAAYRFWVRGIVAGKPFIEIEHVTRMGQHLMPEWPRLGRDGGYRMEIDAYPPIMAELPMGLPGGTGSTLDDAMTMTSARCVNSVEAVVEAAPGYKTFLDLPPIGGRHAVRPNGK